MSKSLGALTPSQPRHVEHVADSLRERVGRKWLLQKRSAALQQPVFADGLTSVAGNEQDFEVAALRGHEARELAAIDPRHDDVRQ